MAHKTSRDLTFSIDNASGTLTAISGSVNQQSLSKDLGLLYKSFGILCQVPGGIPCAPCAGATGTFTIYPGDPLLIDWDRNAEAVRQLAESGEVPRLPLYGELWARGFLHAVDLARDDWDELPGDDEEGAQLVDESLAAIVAGADGLMIEMHPTPELALSDGAQSLDPRQFAAVSSRIRDIVAWAGKTMG